MNRHADRVEEVYTAQGIRFKSGGLGLRGRSKHDPSRAKRGFDRCDVTAESLWSGRRCEEESGATARGGGCDVVDHLG